MSVVVPDAVALGVAAILAKEGFGVIKWAFGRKKPNGKETAEATKGLLNDIKGISTATLSRVGKVEERQGEMTTALGIVATEVKGFDTRCKMHMDTTKADIDGLEERVGRIDQRIFDLQAKG